ncbi:Hypothetical protein FKW44_018315, partial [Caligus rogercresseyi]
QAQAVKGALNWRIHKKSGPCHSVFHLKSPPGPPSRRAWAGVKVEVGGYNTVTPNVSYIGEVLDST